MEDDDNQNKKHIVSQKKSIEQLRTTPRHAQVEVKYQMLGAVEVQQLWITRPLPESASTRRGGYNLLSGQVL